MYVDEAKAIELKKHNTRIGFLIFSFFMIRKYNIMEKTNKNLKLIWTKPFCFHFVQIIKFLKSNPIQLKKYWDGWPY